MRIKEAKEEYKTKLEKKLEQINLCDVCRSLKNITGLNRSGSKSPKGSHEWANELNQFFYMV